MNTFFPNGEGPTAADYKSMTQEEHVLARPEMYVGNPTPEPVTTWIFDGQKMTSVEFPLSRALERLYLEVLTNASDNVGRTRRSGNDAGKIYVEMNQQIVRIRNEGLPIPITIHPDAQVYTPELIFGQMLTSSNYVGDRHEAGTNGIGAKATNILSSYFSVYVEDAINHLCYRQTWTANKRNRSLPEIQPFTGNGSSVTVEYVADFPRFGQLDGYSSEYFYLFMRHALDVSFNAKVPLFFNGQPYDACDVRSYGRFYFGDAVDDALLHYEWPEGAQIIKKPKGLQICENPNILPRVELLVLDTPEEGKTISFVNCMMTEEGGVHVNEALEKVVGETLAQINNSTGKRKKKGEDAKVRKYKLTLADVKPHLSMLLAVRVENPRFNSASKTKLAAPKPKIEIESSKLNVVKKWRLTERLLRTLEAREEKSLSSTDGKKKRYISVENARDANLAGGKESPRCILVITEGKSGAGYANTMLKFIVNGTDIIGILPMRGKILNVRDCPPLQLIENAEINKLKEMLGLQEGMVYDSREALSTLRYGSVLIMADSDVDGKHIIGLATNYFDVRFRSLLQCGFVSYLRTPIVRVKKGGETFAFLTEQQYEQWKEATPDHTKWTIQYFKGLGTSEDTDIKEDLKDPFYVNMVYDEKAEEHLRLAFDKNYSDHRKRWIFAHRPTASSLEKVEQISKFIDTDLVEFSISNVQRSIPNMMDGFKISQRKVMHYMIKNFKSTTEKKKPIKVAQAFAGTALETNYHHAETNLEGVIVKMAQRFVGTNNVPLLRDKGQFGSRVEGGADCADGRYIFTRPEKIFWKIFRREDLPILNYLVEEGDTVEPETYYPIIPQILVNGCLAIATGFSTFIPNHNPISLINWLLLRLDGHQASEIESPTPWYRGFNGQVEVRKNHRKTEDDMKKELFDEEFESEEVRNFFDTSHSKMTMITRGRIETKEVGRSGKLIVEITELPIGVWPLRYLKFLNSLRELKVIKDYSNHCAGDKVHFILEGMGHIPSLKDMKLERGYGISNMVALDEKKNPIIFQGSSHLLDVFYEKRLAIYEKRKAHELKTLEERIHYLLHKKALIQLFLANRERFINVPKPQVKEFILGNGIPYEVYDKMKLQSITTDDIEKIEQKIRDEHARYLEYQAVSVKDIWRRELLELEEALKHIKYE